MVWFVCVGELLEQARRRAVRVRQVLQGSVSGGAGARAQAGGVRQHARRQRTALRRAQARDRRLPRPRACSRGEHHTREERSEGTTIEHDPIYHVFNDRSL